MVGPRRPPARRGPRADRRAAARRARASHAPCSPVIFMTFAPPSSNSLLPNALAPPNAPSQLLGRVLLDRELVRVQLLVRLEVGQQPAVALVPLLLVGDALELDLPHLREAVEEVVAALLLQALVLPRVALLLEVEPLALELERDLVVLLLLRRVLHVDLLVLVALLAQLLDLRREQALLLAQLRRDVAHDRRDLLERALFDLVDLGRALRRGLELVLHAAVARHALAALLLRVEAVDVGRAPAQDLLGAVQAHALGAQLGELALELLVLVRLLAQLRAVPLELLARHELRAADLRDLHLALLDLVRELRALLLEVVDRALLLVELAAHHVRLLAEHRELLVVLRLELAVERVAQARDRVLLLRERAPRVFDVLARARRLGEAV